MTKCFDFLLNFFFNSDLVELSDNEIKTSSTNENEKNIEIQKKFVSSRSAEQLRMWREHQIETRRNLINEIRFKQYGIEYGSGDSDDDGDQTPVELSPEKPKSKREIQLDRLKRLL